MRGRGRGRGGPSTSLSRRHQPSVIASLSPSRSPPFSHRPNCQIVPSFQKPGVHYTQGPSNRSDTFVYDLTHPHIRPCWSPARRAKEIDASTLPTLCRATQRCPSPACLPSLSFRSAATFLPSSQTIFDPARISASSKPAYVSTWPLPSGLAGRFLNQSVRYQRRLGSVRGIQD